MQLQDQFGSGRALDLRSYRNLLDTIGACENLPIALVERNIGDDHLLVSSFSAPLFELLRSRAWFRAFERGLIKAAFEANPGGLPDQGVRLSYSSRLEGRVVAVLIPTPDPETFVMCGPVWLRNSETLREPFTQGFVEAAAKHIVDIDIRERTDSEAPLSLDRVRRVLQHRAAMAETDLIERVSQVSRTIDCLMAGVAPRRLTADQIERVALAICFWNRRTDLLGDGPRGCRLLENLDAGTETDGLMFVLDRGENDRSRLHFNIVERESTAVSDDLFLTFPVAEKWSFFCDTYRSNRNVFFLERILLIRLWLQDNFSGIAADDEIGGKQSRKLLDELMKRLQRILGADACILYRYAPGETPNGPADPKQPAGYLRRLAYHYVPHTGLQREAGVEAKRMEQIGASPERRASSISYRALDDKQTKYDPDAKAEDMYVVAGTVPPQTILATPLISRGCAWGVIEIFGCDRHQFPYSNIRWIEELSRILTPILFDHWLTYRLREISRIAMAETISEETTKYEQVLDHIRKLLMASSARLYLQTTNQTDEFVEKAHAGQSFLPGVATSFNLQDKDSVSAQAIERREIWYTGQVGVAPFDEPSEAKPLQSQGQKGCAIIPIYNGRGNCFATLMVTSTDNTFLTAMWDSTVAAISKNLNVVLEAIHLQDTRVEARQTYFAHTIKTRTIRVDQGGQRLLSQLEPLLGSAELMSHIHQFANDVEIMASISGRQTGRALSPASLEVLRALRATFPAPTSADGHKIGGLVGLVGDLRGHLSELRKSAVFIAGGANAEHPREAHPDTWDGTWADLRLCLLASLKPREKSEGPRSNIHVPDKSILDTGVKVRLPSSLLTEVLNNLADNAVKYDFSPPSSSLRVRAEPSARRYSVEFRNMAPYISQKEATKLKSNSGYRAEYALRKSHDGSGVGLRFIRDMARAWGFTFEYSFPVAETTEEEDKRGWHSARLVFPVSIEY